MSASAALPAPPAPVRKARWYLGLVILLMFPACHPPPSTLPQGSKEQPVLQDPAWFGEGVRPAPLGRVPFAWARPGLDLRGQPMELAPWEVAAAPPPGAGAGGPWTTKRDQVTQVLQVLAAEGFALAQQWSPPGAAPPVYRVQGRVLAFDRQARVAAKAGQVAGNIALVPVNLALLLLSNGALNQPLFISGVSGYRTDVLFQVKAVDLRTGGTVLALQDRLDFKSLQSPTSLPAAIWELAGRPAAEATWWPARELHEADGDKVWFSSGLDLSQARIHCLRWLPGQSLDSELGEKELKWGLQANRMPRKLAEPEAEKGGPTLSETEGTLFLQGEAQPRNGPICRVRLWDPATGQVLGLMQVSKGFWRTDIEKDWARRIRKHLRSQKGPTPAP